MKQVLFVFDDEQPTPPELHIERQREDQLVDWMAQAIVSVFQDIEGDDYEDPRSNA